jgi:hypothetical protein
MQADVAAIDKNSAEEHLLVVILALAGSDMDGAAALIQFSILSYVRYQPWKLCDECCY